MWLKRAKEYITWKRTFLQVFLPNWEDSMCWGWVGNPHPPIFIPSPFLFYQTIENCHIIPIFFPLFFIISPFTQTKHNLKLKFLFQQQNFLPIKLIGNLEPIPLEFLALRRNTIIHSNFKQGRNPLAPLNSATNQNYSNK